MILSKLLNLSREIIRMHLGIDFIKDCCLWEEQNALCPIEVYCQIPKLFISFQGTVVKTPCI